MFITDCTQITDCQVITDSDLQDQCRLARKITGSHVILDGRLSDSLAPLRTSLAPLFVEDGGAITNCRAHQLKLEGTSTLHPGRRKPHPAARVALASPWAATLAGLTGKSL